MTTKQIVKAVGTVATVVVIRFGGMLIRSGLAVNRLLKLAPGLKLASMLFVIAAHPAFASTFTAFGPQTYQRRTGAPVTTSQTFSILNPSTKYSLHVTTDRVSSAIILLNRTPILQPGDFHGDVTSIVRTVQLQISNTVEVELRGKPGSSLSLEIVGIDNDLPSITATVTPALNNNGWNRSDVTVNFTCSDATSRVAVCPAPVIVRSEGAGQIITGTTVDRAGNRASSSVTVNLDKTPPTILITAPTSGSLVTTPTVSVVGTVNDALSGVAEVSCGDTTASVLGSIFNCTVNLNFGPNTLVVRAKDVAGNSNSASTEVFDNYFSTLPLGSSLPDDSDCTSRVRHSSFEPRPDNTTANNTAGVTCFAIGACSAWSEHLYVYVTRVDGLFTGTTDEILQWGACKWGLDEDIQRARAVQESFWHQSAAGDYTTSASLCNSFGLTAPCYQSYGLLQIKASTGPGYPDTYPYSKNSTAFNVDFSLGWLRGCFDGYDTFLGTHPRSTRPYTAGDIWGCVGAWFSGSWYDSLAQNYINSVQTHLANKVWLQPDFVHH